MVGSHQITSVCALSLKVKCVCNTLIHIFSKEKSLDATVLVVFAHEGNNLPESFQLVDYLNEWKNYIKVFTTPRLQSPL